MKYQGDNKEVLFTDVRKKPDVKKVSNYQIFSDFCNTIIEFKECILVAKQGEWIFCLQAFIPFSIYTNDGH